MAKLSKLLGIMSACALTTMIAVTAQAKATGTPKHLCGCVRRAAYCVFAYLMRFTSGTWYTWTVRSITLI